MIDNKKLNRLDKEIDVLLDDEHQGGLVHFWLERKLNKRKDKKSKEITKEDVKKHDGCTVGDLKHVIKKYNIPDSAKILVEKVEDIYYDLNNWGVYLKKGDAYYDVKKYEEKNPESQKLTEEQLKDIMDQYHPAWWPICYEEDKEDFLFICMHY